MNYRPLGRTGWNVSEVSFGAWAIGGTWGTVDDGQSMAALHKAADLGVNLFDTADVYGDGRSERLIGKLLRERPGERLYVATKFGRRLNPHVAEGYNLVNFEAFLDRSLDNLGVEAVDLVQLHCPPSEVFSRPEVFEACERLIERGKLRHYGVSVEKCSEALAAMAYPGVQSIQIIFNMFRLKPLKEVLPQARERQVGILARLPLASGMLTGKITKETKFEPDDHRAGNREGQWFDKGETFSGVPFEVGLAAVEELRELRPPGATVAQFAMRWILDHPAVTCVIPGAKRPSQAEENCRTSDLPPLSEETMRAVEGVYDRRIRSLVHGQW